MPCLSLLHRRQAAAVEPPDSGLPAPRGGARQSRRCLPSASSCSAPARSSRPRRCCWASPPRCGSCSSRSAWSPGCSSRSSSHSRSTRPSCFLQAHGLRRRGAATAVIYVGALAASIALLAALLLPPLIDEAEGLTEAVPGYVEDITAGRGPLGFLERDYEIVERVRSAIERNGGSLLGGGAGTLLDLGRGVLTGIVGVRHDRVPDAVHAPRGPAVGGARRSGSCRPTVAAALAQRRPPDRADRLGLRHGQPADLA